MNSSVFQTAGKSLVLNATSQNSTVAVEEAENRRIAAARARKEERRLRLLNARQRTIGIDVDFIAKQQAEHAEAKRREKEEDIRYAREQASIDRALENFELQVEAQRQLKNEQAKAEWERQLAMRKLDPNFELNDKDALKKQLPARVGDNDPRLGPASMQVFDGEDLKEAERRELQAKQMKNWCIEQNMKKRVARIRELEEEYEYRRFMEQVEELRQRADEVALAEAKRRVEEAKAKNAALIEERKAERQRRREEEEAANEAQLAAALDGGILAEGPADARSALGAGRIRPDHYRGMSSEQSRKYRELQAQQREAARLRKEEERAAERAEAARMNEILRAAARIEAAQEEQRKVAAAQYKAALDQQKLHNEAQRARQREEDMQPAFTDGFFGGFGQSDR